MKIIKIIITLLFPILLSYCNIAETQEQTDEFSDDVVKSKVYSGPKYPADFFYEEISNFSLNYIENWDIPESIEPATDNYDYAVDLVNARLNELSLDPNKLGEGNSTEKYFEFFWPSDSLANNKDFVFRVHKKSYFDGVKYGTLDENKFQITELGTINFSPISLQFVEELFDRLWFFKHYNFGGAVVLKRTTEENEENFKYEIYYTKTSFGDYGLQDKINIYKGEFEIDKSTGVPKIKYSFIKLVKGNYN